MEDLWIKAVYLHLCNIFSNEGNMGSARPDFYTRIQKDNSQNPLSQAIYLYIRAFTGDELSIGEENLSDIQHGVIVPLIIPVNGTAVNQGRVHAAALAEFSARWTHGEHHVEVLSDAVDKELIHGLLGVRNVRLRGGLFEVHPDSIPLLGVEQVWNLTGVQDTINVLQEGFLT